MKQKMILIELWEGLYPLIHNTTTLLIILCINYLFITLMSYFYLFGNIMREKGHQLIFVICLFIVVMSLVTYFYYLFNTIWKVKKWKK